ncbi:MAG: hypothetical protein IJJ61_01570 [Clostridia bacterium]|nr:hypothetical protein [Clostridia bacterium]
MPYKTIKFNRVELYKEIWETSLSQVSKKYDVPYGKLKEACEEYDIPIQPHSYWGNKAVGKPVETIPLPDSDENEVVIDFRTKSELKAGAFAVLFEKQASKASPIGEKDLITPKNSSSPNRYERNVLYEEVWEEPCTKVSAKYGVSDVMIHKVCKSLDIPVPPRGYWAKKAAGQKVKKTPLSKHTGKDVIIGSKIMSAEEKAINNVADKSLSFLTDEERDELIEIAMNMSVADESKKLHTVLRSHKAKYKAWKVNHPRDDYATLKKDRYRRIPDGEPELWIGVSESILPRIYLILDALYNAVESLGGGINDDLSMTIRDEKVYFYITESQTSTDHVMTAKETKEWEEYQRRKASYSYAWKPNIRKYDYIPTGKLTFNVPQCGLFRDSENKCIENRVGEILLALYAESEVVKKYRLEREEAERKAEEERKRKEQIRERYNDEIDRFEALENEATDYNLATMIRNYISAVESKSEIDEQTKEWVKWAKAKADWIDPTVSAEDPFFGKRDHSQSSDRKKPSKKSSYWLF